MNNTIKFWARKCTCCNKGMNEGFVFSDGDEYACNESCRDTISQDVYKKSWKKLTQTPSNYYTEWDVENDFQYQEINNILTDVE